MAPEVQTPAPPEILPAPLQAQWRKTYAEALEQAKADEPDDPARQKMLARREANRLLRTPKLTSYEDAAGLKDWQVISRVEADGVLKGVTFDGKKFRFPVPAKRAGGKPAASYAELEEQAAAKRRDHEAAAKGQDGR